MLPDQKNIARKLYMQEYRKENRAKLNKQKCEYYAKNKDKLRKYKTEWIEKNPDAYLKYYLTQKQKGNRKEYQKNKYKNNIDYKIKVFISTKIYRTLKSQNVSKNRNKTLDYLQYSLKDLKKHLEAQFENWMTWKNHGKYIANNWDDNNPLTWTWQIDHIVPQTDLPYKSMDDENFKKCWALENLRPLNAKQNVLDGVTRKRHGVK